MNLAELTELAPGTPLLTTGGSRITFTGLTRLEVNGRVYTHVEGRDSSRRRVVYKPRGLQFAPDPYRVIAAERDGLGAHTITVERVDRETARAWNGVTRAQWECLIGRLAVVERHDGQLGKVCAIEGVDGIADAEIAAQAAAHVYGAEYVPAE